MSNQMDVTTDIGDESANLFDNFRKDAKSQGNKKKYGLIIAIILVVLLIIIVIAVVVVKNKNNGEDEKKEKTSSNGSGSDKKEVFAVFVPDTVYENKSLDEQGHFIDLSPYTLLKNSGYEMSAEDTNNGYYEYKLATQSQIEDAMKRKGMQVCSWSAFEHEGKVRAGYPLQDAAPGSCAIANPASQYMFISGRVDNAKPWNIFLYGIKPPLDLYNGKQLQGTKYSKLAGKVIWPFYKPAVGLDRKEIWSIFDV